MRVSSIHSLLAAFLLLTAVPGKAQKTPAAAPLAPSAAKDAALARAVHEVGRIDALRSTLARTFAAGGVIATESTFAQVCKPVKVEAMKVAKANGWSFAQLAERNRNPDNALDAEGRRGFRQLQRDPTLVALVLRTSMNGARGVRYVRRITVENACLACHGARDARPGFVKQGYPNDRAFGFASGDLRGIYSVFIPDAADRR